MPYIIIIREPASLLKSLLADTGNSVLFIISVSIIVKVEAFKAAVTCKIKHFCKCFANVLLLLEARIVQGAVLLSYVARLSVTLEIYGQIGWISTIVILHE